MRHGPTSASLEGDAKQQAPAGRAGLASPIRFVQLPVDFERSPVASFLPGTTPPRCLKTPAPAEAGGLLGPLVAFLHRYTDQGVIALDLFLADGAPAIALDVPVAGDAAVGQIDREVARQLQPGNASPLGESGCANVAVTLADHPAPGGERGEGIPTLTESVSAGYDVHFIFQRQPGTCWVTLVYNAALLAASSAERLVESFVVLFEAAARGPDTAVNQLALVSAAQFQALTADLDSGVQNYPALPLCRLFAAIAQRQPGACAAIHRDRSISYGELDERSNRLSHYLLAQGVGPGVSVAVCVTPSLDIQVAILAIWKARGIYLPLDPTHPPMLIARMIEEARPALALTLSGLARLTDGLPQFHFDAGNAILAACEATSPATAPEADDVAYLFYTSGTTGLPKGVMATQGNLLQYLHSARTRYGFTEGDRFCSLARYTFSISLFELVLPLACGASLLLLDRDQVLDPASLFAALDKATVVHAGPSLLGNLFRYLRASGPDRCTLPGMRHASSGGDIVSPAVMEEMKQVFPNAELFVIYGCTEISCMGTTFVIPRETPVTRSFVGRPFANVTLRVLDASRNLVPFGVIGEIHFAGKGIARGYLERPDLTAEKFIDINGQRYYQTGDVGRLHADGNLEMLGRRDFQVKVRGIRIELGGIEKAILRQGLAAQCAVVSRAVGNEPACLVAFLVKPVHRRIALLRRALAVELPDYMLLQHLVELDAMPLTVNGKLDRARLKEVPIEQPLHEEQHREPATRNEQIIAGIFARLLDRPSVRVDETFFDLGGHSLLGVILLEEIRKATGLSIPPRILFENGTVEALAACAEISADGQNNAILLNEPVPGPALFMVSGAQYYRKLAGHLDGLCTVYGAFTPRGLGSQDETGNSQSIDDLVREHLDIIRAQQPRGPYRLLGFSFAGLVAYEVARRLRAAGEEVSLLVLLDTQLEEFTGWKYRISQLARIPLAPSWDVIRYLYRRAREKFAHFGYEATGENDSGSTKLLKHRRDEINLRIAASYVAQMGSYEGRMTLVISNHRLRDEPLKSRNAGWKSHVEQLEVVGVDADHNSMISEEPHVSTVAEIIRARLA